MIAFVKDILIYIVIAVAVIYLPLKFGGWLGIFDAAEAKMAAPSAANPSRADRRRSSPSPLQHWAYASLALGSAMALFMYPHCVTATLSSKDRSTGRRNAAILPAYSLLLGLLALLGYIAIKAGTKPIGLDGKPNPQLVIPQLFEDNFPDWFTGVAFGAIAIGALVPAAIMSIAAANLFTRNVYKAYLKPEATDAQEAKVSKIVSLITKLGALLFVLTLDKQNALNFQLLGGIWILQTLPSIVFGLFTRWFHRWALLAGWAVGMIYGTVTAYGGCTACTPAKHFGNSLAVVPGLGRAGYIGLTTLVVNIVVAVRADRALPGAEGQQRHRHHPPVRLLRRHRRSRRRARRLRAQAHPLSCGRMTPRARGRMAASRATGTRRPRSSRWVRPAASAAPAGRRARTTASAPTPDGREPARRHEPHGDLRGVRCRSLMLGSLSWSGGSPSSG